MQVNVHLPSEKSWTHGINQDVTTTELVELWCGGAMIAAQPKEATSKAKPPLDAADVAFVEINLVRLPIGHVLSHPFTQQFLTVAAYQGDGTSGLAVLAFKLSKTARNGRHVSMVMKGLETLYAGSQAHGDVLQGFGTTGLTNFFVPDSALSAEAEKVLASLGMESRTFNAQQYQKHPPRSRFHLDLETVVRWGDVAPDEEGLNEDQLSMFPTGAKVYCPVHADAIPTAVVVRDKAGSPAVICSHCKRTYGLDRSYRYDFGFSRRVFQELAAEELAEDGANSRFVVTQSPYLPPVPFDLGITCIQSGKGTGKTTQLVELVKECKARNLRVLLIGHRRILLQSLADKLGLTNYLTLVDEADEGEEAAEGEEFMDLKLELIGLEKYPSARGAAVISSEMARNDPTDHYAISLDSLGNLTPEKDRYDFIIIDECEQVFTHLISKTLREKRREVYLRLRHYLRVAKAVCLLDADLNMVTMETLFKANIKDETPFRVFINEPVQHSESTRIYSNDKQLVAQFMASVTAGEKIFVATNSFNEALRLAEIAEKAKPDARVVAIHSKNSQTPEVQKLIGNIASEFEKNIDVLIASPALGTGVDISFRDAAGNPRSVVQKVFGFFKRNITTHFDIDQAIMRVREPGEVHIWVDAWQHQFECDPAILYSMLEGAVKDSHRTIGYDDDGKAILAPEDGLLDVWARISAASRGSKNDLAALYMGLRRRNGYKLVSVDLNEEAQKVGQTSLASARETLRAEREAALLAADIIDSQIAKKLVEQDTNGSGITDEERWQLERYWLETFYHEGIGAELIALDDEGRLRDKVRNFECLTEPEARLLNQDEEELRGLLPFDRRLRLLRRKLLSKLFWASGLYDPKAGKFSTMAAVEQQGLPGFVELIVAYRKRMELVFGLVVRRDVRAKPVIQLRELLALVGLTLGDAEVKEVSGRKLRRYRLEEQRLSDILTVVARREEERLKWDNGEADKSNGKDITNAENDLSGQHTSNKVEYPPSEQQVGGGGQFAMPNIFKLENRPATTQPDSAGVVQTKLSGREALMALRIKKAAAGMKQIEGIFSVS